MEKINERNGKLNFNFLIFLRKTLINIFDLIMHSGAWRISLERELYLASGLIIGACIIYQIVVIFHLS